MTSTTSEIASAPECRTGFLDLCQRAFLSLASWTERNVPVGDDGQRIPENVRRIIDNCNFYI